MKRNALQSLHGVSAPREQTVLTPPILLGPIQTVWGSVVLDPCAPPEGPIAVPCPECPRARGICKWCGGAGETIHRSHVQAETEIRLPDDGLAALWPDRTFVNPPYKKLRPWLEHETGGRTAWLVPVRPHRKWWRAWARAVDVVAYLNPFAFVGHKGTFPAPMCLGYRGADHGLIEELYLHHGLGDPI